MVSSKLVLRKKNPKNQEKSKAINKSNLEKKQNQEENSQNKQQDQELSKFRKKNYDQTKDI